MSPQLKKDTWSLYHAASSWEYCLSKFVGIGRSFARVSVNILWKICTDLIFYLKIECWSIYMLMFLVFSKDTFVSTCIYCSCSSLDVVSLNHICSEVIVAVFGSMRNAYSEWIRGILIGGELFINFVHLFNIQTENLRLCLTIHTESNNNNSQRT